MAAIIFNTLRDIFSLETETTRQLSLKKAHKTLIHRTLRLHKVQTCSESTLQRSKYVLSQTNVMLARGNPLFGRRFSKTGNNSRSLEFVYVFNPHKPSPSWQNTCSYNTSLKKPTKLPNSNKCLKRKFEEFTPSPSCVKILALLTFNLQWGFNYCDSNKLRKGFHVENIGNMNHENSDKCQIKQTIKCSALVSFGHLLHLWYHVELNPNQPVDFRG